MTRISGWLAPLAAITWVTACGEAFGPIEDLPRELSVAEAKLVEADNRFASKLFREIAGQDTTGGNLFISPLSVAMALGMTYNGAAGETRDAMQAALELHDLTLEDVNQAYRDLIDLLRGLDPRVEFLLANSIWYRAGRTPLPTFLERTQVFFDAQVRALDFADPGAAPTINRWVDEHTRGKITEIVRDPIPGNVLMYLLNAVYFKGDWTYQFDKDLTHEAEFTLADGSRRSVPMMARREEHAARIHHGGDVVVVDLPYGAQAYSMTVALPQDPTAIGDLAADLTPALWDQWIAALDSTTLFVELPKFTVEYEITLNSVLGALGMGVAFSPAADFSQMYEAGGVWIDQVKHKSFVDVNEEGTEAAAVTSVVMTDSAPARLIVDRPFLFAIRERYSGTILFMGRIMDPAAG